MAFPLVAVWGTFSVALTLHRATLTHRRRTLFPVQTAPGPDSHKEPVRLVRVGLRLRPEPGQCPLSRGQILPD